LPIYDAKKIKKAIPKNNYLKNYVTDMLHICSKYIENNLIKA